MSLVPEDIEAIERATFDAVPPESLHACGPWLVAIDRGTVGRARSAVPLRHAQPAPDALDAIEAVYAAHGLGAMLRVPAAGEYDALRATRPRAGLHHGQTHQHLHGFDDGHGRAGRRRAGRPAGGA
jgi:hypothetical protein